MILWTRLVVLSTMFFMSGCSVKPSADVSFSSITAPEFRAVIEKNPQGSVILDVRTPQEYSEGHIRGASNVDFYAPDFQTRLSNLDKTKTYLIYCHSGNRTSETARIMQRLGFKKIIALAGGVLEWSANNFPLEK